MMRIVFSDLDGTFLDHSTYSWEKSMPGYEELKRHSVPLIFVSSKTFDEMAEISRQLGHTRDFIFENGCGVGRYDPVKSSFTPELIGASYEELVASKDQLRRAFKAELTTFDEMTVEDVISVTGLSRENAAAAKRRMGSLPFISDAETVDLDVVNKKLTQHDRLCTKGGRLYHYSSINATKGLAVRKLIKEFSTDVFTMAVGDSRNDIPMLEVADVAYLVKRHDGSCLDANFSKTKHAGPEGFSEAVMKFMETN